MNAGVAAVIVTFNPDESTLARLLEALRPQVGAMVIVDNGSGNAAVVGGFAEQFDATLIANSENLGVAAAQNQGIRWALSAGARFVLLSDQDSIPALDMVHQLAEAFDQWTHPSAFFPPTATLLAGFESEVVAPIAAVGPVPTDTRGGETLVSGFSRWRPKRTAPPESGEVLEVPLIIASGMLIPREALLQIGLMNSALFIDNVDTAWCLRALSAGWRILVAGSALLEHSLGGDVAETSVRERPIHLQSPTRNYYIVRNTLLMLRAPFLPWSWKIGYAAWLAQVAGYYALAAPDAAQQRPRLWRGLLDGLRGRTGPIPQGARR